MKQKDGTLIQINKISGICTTFLYIAASKLRIFAIFASRINTFLYLLCQNDFKENNYMSTKGFALCDTIYSNKMCYLFLLNNFMKINF